jgi:hypothetical protein
VISVDIPIFDLRFFVASLVELVRTKKGKLKHIDRTRLSLSTYFANRVFPDPACWVHLETTIAGKTPVLFKEHTIGLVAGHAFLFWVRKPTHNT